MSEVTVNVRLRAQEPDPEPPAERIPRAARVLALAHKFGHRVLRYEDNASGEIGRGEGGLKAVTRITLNPVVSFADGQEPDDDGLDRLHHSAHKYCFVANSLKSEVVINR